MIQKNVLIVDDHSAVRNGLKLILSNKYPEFIYKEVANASEALSNINESKKWDLVILDINLPDKSGLEVLTMLGEKVHGIHILVFSFHIEPQIAWQALRLGATGFISKDANDAALLHAVRNVLAGERYIPKELSELLIHNGKKQTGYMLHEFLSDRELQTLQLLASGKNISQISEILSLSISTVSTYRSRVLKKLNLDTTASLIRYAIEQKLI